MAGIFENPLQSAAEVDAVLEKAQKAQDAYKAFSDEDVSRIFKKVAAACTLQRVAFAKLAVDETKAGLMEDGVIKNHFAAEYVYHRYRDKTSKGFEKRALDRSASLPTQNMTHLMFAGPVLALASWTNPTTATIFRCLLALKSRSAITFLPDARSQRVTFVITDFIRKAAVKAGAPDHLINCVRPSAEMKDHLLNHPAIRLVLASPEYKDLKSPKTTLIGGPGNAPMVIDASANLEDAVTTLCLGKIFDNSIAFALGQATIVVDQVYEAVKGMLKDRGALFLSADQKAKLSPVLALGGKTREEAYGQSAETLLTLAGLVVPTPTPTLLVAELTSVGADEPLALPKHCPLVALYKASSFEDAVKTASALAKASAEAVVSGLFIDPKMADAVRQFKDAVPTKHVLVNPSPSLSVIVEPSLTLDAAISDNAEDRQILSLNTDKIEWIKIPRGIYFNKYCTKDALLDLDRLPMEEDKRVLVVTDRVMVELGMVSLLVGFLKRTAMKTYVFDEVTAEPTIECIRDGIKAMESFRPNIIVALGGGSPIDAAKTLRLLYEHPELDLDELAARFIEMRHRNVEFPHLGSKIKQLVAIPTTSGTGAEMTPFTDIINEQGNKVPICSYRLTPDMAIVDSMFADLMPPKIAINAALGALSASVESHASVYSSDFTRPYSRQAFADIVHHLADWEKSDIAKQKIHNAASIAGIAFANAFLGLTTAMSHPLSSEFGIPHGLLKALILPHVVKFNAAPSSQLRHGYFPQHSSHSKTLEAYEDLLVSVRPTSKAVGPQARVEALIQEIETLKASVGVKGGLKDHGVPRDRFMELLDVLSEKAFDDQCTGTNPRYPLVSEIRQLYLDAFEGKI